MPKSIAQIAEEQCYARQEILTCARALEREPDAEIAPVFAAAVREYLEHEPMPKLELDGPDTTAEDNRRAKLLLADVLEGEFARCRHPHAESADADWCSVCGSTRLHTRAWVPPHWREIILRALLAGVLMMLAACGGSALDVGSTSVEALCQPWDAAADARLVTRAVSLVEPTSPLTACPCSYCRQAAIAADGAILGCCAP